MSRRCTSSGPSAIRSVRSPAHIIASGVSSLTPAPPWVWIARSTTSRAIRGATTLMAAISLRAPFAPTVSIIHAALRVSSRACSIAIRDSAIHCCTTPWRASGLPNATRSTERRHIRSSARSAMPIARMQWWMRPGPSRAWAIAKPGALLAQQVGHRDAHVGERDLRVPVLVVVAEHRHVAHDLDPGGVDRHQHHRLLVVHVGRPGRSCP